MSGASLRVLVTAGASGIGRAIADAFAADGALVHVCDIDEAAIVKLASENDRINVNRADVAVEGDVDALFADIEDRFGGLDVLVNNAGIAGPTGPVESLTLEDWRRCVEVNLDGAFLCARHAVRMMKAAGSGSIINIASTAGFWGYPLRTPYASAKWAIIGFTKSLAMEVGPLGIRVNAICPGVVEGPRMEQVIAAEAEATGRAPEEVREAYLRSCSLRTLISGADIAAAAIFLCSPAARKITGQSLPVDGHTESLSS